VTHRRLISKLYFCQVNRNIILWIADFLHKRQLRNYELQLMANSQRGMM